MNKNWVINIFVLIVLTTFVSAGFLSTTVRFNPSGWEDNGSVIRTLTNNPVNIFGNVSIGGGFDNGGIDLTTVGEIRLFGDILIRGDILTITDQEINGSFLPTDDNKFDLGSAILRWKDIYVSGTIFGGTFLGLWQLSNFTNAYDNRDDRFDNENFTTRYDLRTDRFDNENFTTRYDLRTDRWDLENSSAQGYIKNNTDANITTLTTYNITSPFVNKSYIFFQPDGSVGITLDPK